MAKLSDPNNPWPAKVVRDDNAPINEQDYTATAIVDGKQLRILLVENAAGIKNNKNATLTISTVSKEGETNRNSANYTAFAENKFNSITTPSGDYLAQKGFPANLVDEAFDRFEGKGERALANQAPEIVKMIEHALLGKNAKGEVTLDEFRKIRDTFQRIDAAPSNATNTALPQPAAGKGSVPIK